MATGVLVLCLSQVPTASGAVPQSVSLPATEAAPVHVMACPTARQGLRFYQARAAYWAHKMGAPRSRPERAAMDRLGCPRYLAALWRDKAHAARKEFERWFEYHYDWSRWLPAKHRRVGACETGYGREPGDFTWDSGLYVSFAGIYREGYDDDAHRVGNLGWDETKRKLGRLPTPREQMQAVDSHRAAHGGWSGWGCRGS